MGNRTTLTVQMQEPVLVATSAAGETRWGFHQFPAMSRLPDGGILLMFADAKDASETHGEPGPAYISRDAGRSWSPMRPQDGPTPVRPHFSVSEVFDGEYLVVPAVKYLDIDQAGVVLPEPAARANTYGENFTYRCADLPPAVQEYFRLAPAWRWRPDRAVWENATVEFETAGLLARRRANSKVLPRSFFERQVLRYRGELLYADYRAAYARPDGSVPGKLYTSLMVSTDNGRTFQRRATIAMDPADRDLMGEPQLSATADGRLVCVIRRADHEQKPSCVTWSEDSGHTWTQPRDLFGFGVWPCVLLLGNGTLVLSYGRPGVHLAFDPQGTGETWDVQTTLIQGDHAAITKHTCGYTCLLPLDDESFLIAYSDFLHTNAKGEPCKAIFTRRVRAGL